MLMEENKKLRERVLALESQKEEELQFSTPNGEQKEAEITTKEAAREAEETRNFRSKEAETTKEAAGGRRLTCAHKIDSVAHTGFWLTCAHKSVSVVHTEPSGDGVGLVNVIIFLAVQQTQALLFHDRLPVG